VVQARVNAVAVVFDLMQPVRTSRRFIGEARELRLDPCWRMGRLGDRCCGLDLAPQCAGSTINRRALGSVVRIGIAGYDVPEETHHVVFKSAHPLLCACSVKLRKVSSADVPHTLVQRHAPLAATSEPANLFFVAYGKAKLRPWSNPGHCANLRDTVLSPAWIEPPTPLIFLKSDLRS
jgi:hypothetical protein